MRFWLKKFKQSLTILDDSVYLNSNKTKIKMEIKQNCRKRMKVFIESFACASNTADANRVRSYFDINGNQITDDPRTADLIILMSCGFNQIIKKQHFKRMDELQRLSKNDATIMLGGCISKIDKDYAKDLNKKGIYTFGPREIEMLDNIFGYKHKIRNISPVFKNQDSKIIRISTGCKGKCTYCAIKFANGSTLSRSAEDIKKDIIEGISEGFSQFKLTSEDTGAWGQDIRSNIVNLLNEITAMDGDFRLTLSTIHPKWFLKYPKQLIGALKSRKIAKNIYLPLQSGSNRVLKLMGREYTKEQYDTIYNLIKQEIPEIKIQSDILVGFPSETEEDFRKSFDAVMSKNLYFLQVFAYTDMKGTMSEKIEPKVDMKISHNRVRELINAFLDSKSECVGKRILVNTNIESLEKNKMEV